MEKGSLRGKTDQKRYLFLVRSGHQSNSRQYPLSGAKRTSRLANVTSAFDQKRTLAIPQFSGHTHIY